MPICWIFALLNCVEYFTLLNCVEYFADNISAEIHHFCSITFYATAGQGNYCDKKETAPPRPSVHKWNEKGQLWLACWFFFILVLSRIRGRRGDPSGANPIQEMLVINNISCNDDNIHGCDGQSQHCPAQSKLTLRQETFRDFSWRRNPEVRDLRTPQGIGGRGRQLGRRRHAKIKCSRRSAI